eukprot:2827991-Rhodomonas_salina.1
MVRMESSFSSKVQVHRARCAMRGTDRCLWYYQLSGTEEVWCYGLSGTDEVWCYQLFGTDIGYGATIFPVLTWAMVLPAV